MYFINKQKGRLNLPATSCFVLSDNDEFILLRNDGQAAPSAVELSYGIDVFDRAFVSVVTAVLAR